MSARRRTEARPIVRPSRPIGSPKPTNHDQSARRRTEARPIGSPKPTNRDHSARRNRPITTNRLAETDQSRPIGPPEDRSATNRLAETDQSRPIGPPEDRSATTRLAETDQSRPIGSPKPTNHDQSARRNRPITTNRPAGGQKRDHSARRRTEARPLGSPGGQMRDQSARRNRPITTTRLAETDQSRPLGSPEDRSATNHDHSARRRTEARPIVRPPSTLSRLASGIRSSFSQFFCPPLRFFTKSLFFCPPLRFFTKNLFFFALHCAFFCPPLRFFTKNLFFLPSTLSRLASGIRSSHCAFFLPSTLSRWGAGGVG